MLLQIPASPETIDKAARTFTESGPLWTSVAVGGGVILYILGWMTMKYLPKVHKDANDRMDKALEKFETTIRTIQESHAESLKMLAETHAAEIREMREKHSEERAHFARVTEEFTKELRNVISRTSN